MMDTKTGASLLPEIITYLENQNIEELKQLTCNDDNKNALKEIAWDLVPKVVSYINEENLEKHNFLQCCEDILLKLCEVGNVKEVLLVLLEQVEAAAIQDVTFVTLLTPIGQCLSSLTGKRGYSVAVALETLYGYLETLPLPETHQIGDEERQLLDSDDDVRRTCHVVNEILFFIKNLAKECSSVKERQELVKFLVKLLNYPLGHLDLMAYEYYGVMQYPTPKLAADKLVSILAILEKDFSRIIEQCIKINERVTHQQKTSKAKLDLDDNANDSDDESNLDEPLPEFGLAVFVFLVVMDTEHSNNKPQMLTAYHWLDLSSRFIPVLLKHNNILNKMKGTALLLNLLQSSNDILVGNFHWDTCKCFIDGLVYVMCGSQSKSLAKSALQAFTLIYKLSEPTIRQKILFYLFSELKHSGILGYTIGLFKDDINTNLNRPTERRDANFTQNSLLRISKTVFVLPDSEQTDILENSEQILGMLNLLRFLVVRDKGNETGIWSVISWIEENFNKPLHLGLNMSRAHYKLDLDNLKKEMTQKKVSEGQLEVNISGQSMKGLSHEQKVQVYESALQRFDMIESVLARVRELIDHR